MLTYMQATVIGAVQGVTELFPVSTLGPFGAGRTLARHGWSVRVDQGGSSAGIRGRAACGDRFGVDHAVLVDGQGWVTWLLV